MQRKRCARPSAASVRTLLLSLALSIASDAALAQLYKWTDANGKVQYSDQPPKNFKGEVTRIDPDVPATPATAPVAPRTMPVAREETKAPQPTAAEPAARRRAQREKLAADVTRAKEKLEAAKAALENVGSPTVDERQVVQQHYAKGTKPGTPRSNCREVTREGKKSLMCPALVPNEAYYERVRQLEEAVKRAEDELADAERAYRRGTD